MKRFVLLAILVLPTVAFAQQHAPTVEQCRADRDLWMYQLSGHKSHEDLRKSLSLLNNMELITRQSEMTSCMLAIDSLKIDKSNLSSINGQNASTLILAHTQADLDKDQWDNYLLVRLLYAEEVEERLLAHKGN